ncbi:Clp protease ClpP [Brevibacillus sp. HB1.1]|uniref:head maturation protease, ClpP-related n=1 Tax=Brevibacillus sp. HB1.1 TaxID=2738808 RepID=UPI00157676CB|nr:head maturation protease, ClpP-related [Brevibacillus sp. HB1.1]NTU28859.1 Clp protease ClpP [Brevibacillus sp. HB1.1]
MPKKLKLNGTVVGDSEAWIYEWFGIPTISPGAVAKALEEAGEEDIEVSINSGGGSVFAGSEIYTMIKDHPATITVKITALAASAASFIAMAGDRVLISPTAQIMIHNAATSAWGDKEVMDRGRRMLNSTDEAIANAYALKTGMSIDDLLSMMGKETWLNAQEAKRLGFADEIMFSESEPVVTNNLSMGAVLPPEVIDKIRNELLRSNGVEGMPVHENFGLNIMNTSPSSQSTIKNKEDDKPMNFKELQENHPVLVNEIMTQAISAERNRISALNELADAPGAAPFIQDAIANGETAGDVAMKIIKASAERVKQEGENRQKDAENSKVTDVATQPPVNQAKNEAEEEAAAVEIMVQYATELINKKGGRL